jgi:hypothetical protein
VTNLFSSQFNYGQPYGLGRLDTGIPQVGITLPTPGNDESTPEDETAPKAAPLTPVSPSLSAGATAGESPPGSAGTGIPRTSAATPRGWSATGGQGSFNGLSPQQFIDEPGPEHELPEDLSMMTTLTPEEEAQLWEEDSTPGPPLPPDTHDLPGWEGGPFRVTTSVVHGPSPSINAPKTAPDYSEFLTDPANSAVPRGWSATGGYNTGNANLSPGQFGQSAGQSANEGGWNWGSFFRDIGDEGE